MYTLHFLCLGGRERLYKVSLPPVVDTGTMDLTKSTPGPNFYPPLQI